MDSKTSIRCYSGWVLNKMAIFRLDNRSRTKMIDSIQEAIRILRAFWGHSSSRIRMVRVKPCPNLLLCRSACRRVDSNLLRTIINVLCHVWIYDSNLVLSSDRLVLKISSWTLRSTIKSIPELSSRSLERLAAKTNPSRLTYLLIRLKQSLVTYNSSSLRVFLRSTDQTTKEAQSRTTSISLIKIFLVSS